MSADPTLTAPQVLAVNLASIQAELRIILQKHDMFQSLLMKAHSTHNMENRLPLVVIQRAFELMDAIKIQMEICLRAVEEKEQRLKDLSTGLAEMKQEGSQRCQAFPSLSNMSDISIPRTTRPLPELVMRLQTELRQLMESYYDAQVSLVLAAAGGLDPDIVALHQHRLAQYLRLARQANEILRTLMRRERGG